MTVIRRKGVKIFAALAALFVVLGAAGYTVLSRSRAGAEAGEGEFHFLDVGQGDCALVIYGDSSLVIDTGPSSATSYVTEYISSYTDEIDMLVLTHPHEDHIGGADELIYELDVKTVVMPDAASESAAFGRVLTALEEKNVEVIQGHSGMELSAGEISLELLAPCSAEYTETNNYSIVARVTAAGVSALFTGDAEELSEKEILASAPKASLDCDILKAGHHGSSTSTGSEFLSAVTPQYAVISAGAGNSYGHPHQSVLAALEKANAKTYRTDTDGTVVLRARNGKVIN